MATDQTYRQPRGAWLLLALFVYLLAARTADIHRSMWLLADQIRDWTLALGPFSGLPLVGTPSTAGGVSLGPIYYWILWLSRVCIGPFVHNLPHAGGYGIAILQSLADVLLFHAVARFSKSRWLALAAVLLAATAPHDVAISRMVWNPAVSVAFVKVALAMRLLRPAQASGWWFVGATACSWLAVQAHSSAIFVAAPLVASYVLDEAVERRWKGALERVRSGLEVIVLLQLPFFVYMFNRSAAAVPMRALGNAADSVASGLRLRPSLDALLEFVPSILFAPWRAPAWGVLLALSAAAIVVGYSRARAVLYVTVAPLLLAVVGFSLWRGAYDEYWYLPLAPCGALAIVFALGRWRTSLVAPAMAVALLVAQPARLQTSRLFYPMPQYGALVEGARQIVKHAGTVRRIETTMTLPPLASASFPFEAMGGRFSPDAAFDAVIDANGDVQFRPVPR